MTDVLTVNVDLGASGHLGEILVNTCIISAENTLSSFLCNYRLNSLDACIQCENFQMARLILVACVFLAHIEKQEKKTNYEECCIIDACGGCLHSDNYIVCCVGFIPFFMWTFGFFGLYTLRIK